MEVGKFGLSELYKVVFLVTSSFYWAVSKKTENIHLCYKLIRLCKFLINEKVSIMPSL